MTKTWLAFLSLLCLIIPGCVASGSTLPPAPSATPAVAEISPTPLPAPAPQPDRPSPTPTSTPESRWLCYRGGLACYDDLTSISMLNATEGWAVGTTGAMLHYTTAPGEQLPFWHPTRFAGGDSFERQSLTVVGPDEWWAIQWRGLVHYRDGAVTRVAGIDKTLLDLAVVSRDEV
jgi:hypothetical protein